MITAPFAPFCLQAAEKCRDTRAILQPVRPVKKFGLLIEEVNYCLTNQIYIFFA